ncbi:Flagellar attachment zone protein 1 [Diplonema papillatum]|nr:Flagellar attachment zone protein 1 [Diplonema papillatum]
MKEFEQRLYTAEMDAAKLAEEKRVRGETAQVIQEERDRLKYEFNEARDELSKLAAQNKVLRSEANELEEVRKSLQEQQKKTAQMHEELALEQRRVRELHEAQHSAVVMSYTPPPQLKAIGFDVPPDAPLSHQMQVMFYNTTQQIITYQKDREDAMMQAMRSEQQRWINEMSDREKVREEIERREIERWRLAEQDARRERERKDTEERIARSQKDDQECEEREQRHRREKADLLQQELAEREAWSARVHSEHQQTIERITLGFTTTQEQAMRAHEQQLRSLQAQYEQDRSALRNAHNQQLDNMRQKYEKLMTLQEETGKSALSSITNVKESANKLNEILRELERSNEHSLKLQKSWEASWEMLQREKDESLEDRKALVEDLRLNVAEKHQQLDHERIMLSRLFADFKVAIDTIQRDQQDERSRLTASVTKAEKAREDYEREHKKWMRETLKQKINQDSDFGEAVHKVVSSAEQLQSELTNLNNERRAFDRQREARSTHVTEYEERLDEKRREIEEAAKEAIKKETLINEAGRVLDRKTAELHGQAQQLAAEKEKLRDELYRVKDLGNTAYQKSKDLQKMRDEIRAAAEAVEQTKVQEAQEAEKRKFEQDRLLLEKHRMEFEVEKRRQLLACHPISPSTFVPLTLPQQPAPAPAENTKQRLRSETPQPKVVRPASVSAPTLRPVDVKELLDQKSYLAHNTQEQTNGSSSTDRGVSHRTPSGRDALSARTTAQEADTLESLVGNQWVTLLRLSKDSTPSTSYPSSSTPPYTSGSSYPVF